MSKLYFRYGAMGCGKTMQLLQVAFNYEERGHKVLVMKPKTDTKNGEKLLTRIGPEREVDFCFTKNDDIFTFVSIAHDIDEIKTICECGRKATCNARFLNGKFVADGPDVLIDDGKTEIEYRAICPKCFADYKAGRK